MRRLIALTATAAVALVLAPLGAARAASSEEEMTVVVTAPGEISTAGNVEVTATITDTNAVDSIHTYKVELANAAGVPMGQFCTRTFDKPDLDTPPVDSVSIKFSWNTNKVPGDADTGNCEGGHATVLPVGGALSTNNRYTIKVTATTWGAPDPTFADSDTTSSGIVSVSNDPTKVDGVGLKFDKAAKTVKVSWSGNPEPDVADYRVQECFVDKSSKPCEHWKTKGDIQSTSANIKVEDPGIYRYRVAALRPSATGATMVGAPGVALGDPTEIDVVPDPVEAPAAETSPGEAPADTTPVTVTKTVVKPTRVVQRAAPQVVQRIVEEEPGFNTELPYVGDDEEAIGGRPAGSDGDGGDNAVLIPLAGGALLLVFAMQVKYLTGRVSPALETVPADERWDWDE